MIVTLTSGGDFAPQHTDIMQKVLDDASLYFDIEGDGDIRLVMNDEELGQFHEALKDYERAVYN